MNGLLLFAHGARDPRWADPFHAVAARAREHSPGTPVRLAFLEFMAPDIATAARELAAEGCNAVSVVPVFLGAGGHVRKDLPALLEALRAEHPGVAFTLHPAVGEAPAVIDAMAAVAAAALPR